MHTCGKTASIVFSNLKSVGWKVGYNWTRHEESLQLYSSKELYSISRAEMLLAITAIWAQCKTAVISSPVGETQRLTCTNMHAWPARLPQQLTEKPRLQQTQSQRDFIHRTPSCESDIIWSQNLCSRDCCLSSRLHTRLSQSGAEHSLFL